MKKKYVVAVSDYCGDPPTMFSREKETLEQVIEEIFGEETTLIQAAEANGDGMPYYMIFDVEDAKQVFGIGDER